MATFDLTLQNLVFPNFTINDDNSKKNFRIMFDILYFDKDESPKTALAILPGKEDFWQWENDKRENGIASTVSDDEQTVTLDVTGKFTANKRRILLAQGTLYEIDVKVIDMPDNNFDTLFKVFVESSLKNILEQAGKKIAGTVPGLGFVFSDDNVGKVSDFLVDKIKLKDKILFEGVSESPSKDGDFSITGKGTFRKSHDKKGDYEVRLNTKIAA